MTDAQPLLRALSLGLVPVVLEKLGRSQQAIETWERGLVHDDDGLFDDSLLAAIDTEEQRGRELGFVLALMGERVGADILLARREPQGLRWLFAMVEAGLARRGVELQPPASALPRLVSKERGTHAFSLAAAALAWHLARKPRLAWSWHADARRPALAFGACTSLDAVEPLARLHHGLDLRSAAGWILLGAPASWFEGSA